jgi:phospholipid transport system substrate-binding protein
VDATTVIHSVVQIPGALQENFSQPGFKGISKLFTKLFQKALVNLGFVAAALALTGHAIAQEAPDVLIKRISQEVLEAVRADKEIKSGNRKHITEFIDQRVMPYVDFQRTTALAVGRYWRDATPEQQRRLTDEFRTLLLHTYSGAMSQINDEKLEFKPFRGDPGDGDVEVRFQVRRPRGEPIQVAYRLINSPNGWKIYDVNVLGVWLTEAYKGSFSAAINDGGIDGLIKTLAEKNKKLAGGGAAASKG